MVMKFNKNQMMVQSYLLCYLDKSSKILDATGKTLLGLSFSVVPGSIRLFRNSETDIRDSFMNLRKTNALVVRNTTTSSYFFKLTFSIYLFIFEVDPFQKKI